MRKNIALLAGSWLVLAGCSSATDAVPATGDPASAGGMTSDEPMSSGDVSGSDDGATGTPPAGGDQTSGTDETDDTASDGMTDGSTTPTEMPAEGEGEPEPTGTGDEEPATAGPGEPHDVQSDECGLDTRYPGDEYCILPPPEDEGYQLHVGPDDYENPDPRYLLQPGEEITNSFSRVSTNTEDRFFYYRQHRMRPGAHHMIVSRSGAGQSAGGLSFGGRRIATANISGDTPKDGIIAPENEGVGIPLPARSTISTSLHSINVTDEPILRELWVNFWYKDPDTVTEETSQLFATGDVSFSIAPGEETIMGPYSCDISGEGRMLWFYGHRHANNVRFSAWRERNGQRDLIYEGYDWEEVLVLEYNSRVENPTADRERKLEGGWSGILDLREGDSLVWECHVINQQDTTLRFSNQTYLGEMCIMDGEIVGATCSSGFGF